MQPHEDPVIMDAVRAAKHVQDVLRDAHPQAANIVLAQVALERQLRASAETVCGPALKGLKLAKVGKALRVALPDGYLALVLSAAEAFTDAGNAIAHGDTPAEVERLLMIFRTRFQHVAVALNPATVRYGTAAIGVASMVSIVISEARAARP